MKKELMENILLLNFNMIKSKRKNPYKNQKCKKCKHYWDFIYRCEKHYEEFNLVNNTK